ncbi:pseudouridine synthase [Neisseria perflava]|uniref:pseudouridine synthase n=1 Tax=Neisseria perflava TaxID=33053 RepID=UPI00209EA921|nr:pseudouridine synthase [Neisseria perflava]MCP1660596.1 tRNA pseudouridine32 synthase/23S rRNA pseudouridine746 synthase [Neisseria perflava]MCP1772404.1 tRNA pseudouridine32 synthase/23S rRNA pseudouridine746 synthase [Neisseria perflava]
MKKRTNPLPVIDGIKPSYLVLPHEKQFYSLPLLHFLCHKFPFVGEAGWRARLNSGFVVGADGSPLNEHTPFVAGEAMYYYREISREDEPRIPFDEQILHVDEHLIVVDKPHFLPVIPSGRFLRETLLTRLRLHPDLQHLNTADITPIHRLDKDTAGVMLLSHNAATRRDYQIMFQDKTVRKTYEAVAPLRTDLVYPHTVQSRMVRGEKFYLTQEVAGEANAFTTIELLETRGKFGLYRLTPHTGKKHQLRVHMMNLGMPLVNDALYPTPLVAGEEDYSKPLQLLAKSIEFIDPISGVERRFESLQRL